MAKRNGPPPRPTALKVIEGNPGKRPLNRREARPASGVPSCPAHLSKEAKAEWRRIVPQLHRAGLLTRIDRAALAAYCTAWADWIAARKELEKHGTTFVRGSGAPALSPHVTIANVAMRQMLNLLAEFGMTPSSRSRISVSPDAAELDPAESFFRD